MKTCPKCSSVTFDDMDICYDCMNPFVQIEQGHSSQDQDQDSVSGSAVAKLKVVLADYFAYEMLLTKTDGKSLSVGSAADNAIVIPQAQVAEHQLEIFYAKGQLWVETANFENILCIDGTPLSDARRLNAGTSLQVGDAKITLVDG